MSSGAALAFKEAAEVAVDLLRLLEPGCDRIQVAGSLRRRRPQVHDIEIVAIPRVETETELGLFAEHADVVEHDRLAESLARLRADGTITARDVEVHRADGRVEIQHRLGNAYQALVFRDMPIDLFLTDRDQWGCIFALRTGPHDWNIELVTQIQKHLRRVEHGRVLHLGKPVATPEEADFFRACGQRWVDPPERTLQRVRIDPRLFAEVPA